MKVKQDFEWSRCVMSHIVFFFKNIFRPQWGEEEQESTEGPGERTGFNLHRIPLS